MSMGLFLFNSAIAVINTVMLLLEKYSTKPTATPERTSPVSSRRSSALGPDSGYTSETDVDQHDGKSSNSFRSNIN